MTPRHERITAGILGLLAGIFLMVALLASGWQANAEVREVWDGSRHWMCYAEED